MISRKTNRFPGLVHMAKNKILTLQVGTLIHVLKIVDAAFLVNQ